MSAYGAISTRHRHLSALPSTLWHCKKSRDTSGPQYITIHHLTLETASALPGLVSYLHKSFAVELERGMTYPQEILQGEVYTQGAFEGYFFAADVLVAITGVGELPDGAVDGSKVEVTAGEAKKGRAWEECVAGVYYVSRPSLSRYFA